MTTKFQNDGHYFRQLESFLQNYQIIDNHRGSLDTAVKSLGLAKQRSDDLEVLKKYYLSVVTLKRNIRKEDSEGLNNLDAVLAQHLNPILTPMDQMARKYDWCKDL